LLLHWPLDEARGFLGPLQRVVIELKLLHKSLEATVSEGLEQTRRLSGSGGNYGRASADF
jgi:hypothetical protein